MKSSYLILFTVIVVMLNYFCFIHSKRHAIIKFIPSIVLVLGIGALGIKYFFFSQGYDVIFDIAMMILLSISLVVSLVTLLVLRLQLKG